MDTQIELSRPKLTSEQRSKVNAWRREHRAKHPELRARERASTRLQRARDFDKRRDVVRAQNKKHWLKNRESLLASNRNRHWKNKETNNARSRLYYSENRDTCRAVNRAAYLRSRDARIKRFRRYMDLLTAFAPERLSQYKAQNDLNEKADPNRRLKRLCRSRILTAVKRCVGGFKSARTHELIGCSVQETKSHLESKFQPGMSWANHGSKGWHIDHIIPLDSFDLADPEQQKKAFHYSNTQPLWWLDNLRKGAKYLPY